MDHHKKHGQFCLKRWAMGLIPAYMHGRHQKGFIALPGEAYRGKENKSGYENENQNPGERMHGMKNKTSGHFEKKTKVCMGTKTKTPDERMHEMKTKPKQHL
jgi:hypothetical protein